MTENQPKLQTEQKKQTTQVVLVEGKLTKIILQTGEGQCPTKGQQVSALYRGTLQSGQEFDSNQDRQSPFTFTVGVGQVIKGWDEGFMSMKRGEKATLICGPDYAYGARGSPPRIPQNATLNFQVQLLDFKDKKKEKSQLDTTQKIAEATRLKAQGNESLKSGKFGQAIDKYQEGIEYADFETDQGTKDILKALRMNISQAYINNKEYSKAIQNCNKVLENDSKNIKSLYRRGIAYSKQQDFKNARESLNAVLQIDANHQEAKKELTRIISEQKAIKAKEKKIFGSMFAQGGLYDDKKPQEKKSKPEKVESEEQDELPDLEKDEQEKPPTEEKSQDLKAQQ